MTTDHPISLTPALPRERDRLAAYYRAQADENTSLGLHVLAALCTRQASLAEQGGRAQWETEVGA